MWILGTAYNGPWLSCCLLALAVALGAAADVELISSGMTDWSAPTRVARCPIHEAFGIEQQSIGFNFKPPGGGKFSVVETRIPDELRPSGNTTGLKLTYSASSGAPGVSLWRIRLSYSDLPHVRFVHLFSIPADGVTDETRHMPWTDFTGQVIDFKRKRIVECSTLQNEPNCSLDPARITHISFLESEDTIAHAITLQSIAITEDAIFERNAEQHHTDEQAALLWEREHHALMRGDDDNSSMRHRHHNNRHHDSNEHEETTTTSVDPDAERPYAYGSISVAGITTPSLAFWVVYFCRL